MRNTKLAGALLLCGVMFLAGCSSPAARYKARIKSGLKSLNELYFAYTKIKQKGDVLTVVPEIRDMVTQLNELKDLIDAAEPKDEKVRDQVRETMSPLLWAVLSNVAIGRGKASQFKDVIIPADVDQAVNKVCESYIKLLPPPKDPVPPPVVAPGR